MLVTRRQITQGSLLAGDPKHKSIGNKSTLSNTHPTWAYSQVNPRHNHQKNPVRQWCSWFSPQCLWPPTSGAGSKLQNMECKTALPERTGLRKRTPCVARARRRPRGATSDSTSISSPPSICTRSTSASQWQRGIQDPCHIHERSTSSHRLPFQSEVTKEREERVKAKARHTINPRTARTLLPPLCSPFPKGLTGLLRARRRVSGSTPP